MSPLISGLASVASLLFNAASGGSERSANHANAPRRSAEAPVPSSAVVHLSPRAEALAGLADKGVLISQGTFESPIGATTQAARNGVAQPAGPTAMATDDFKELLTRLGADDGQKAQLAAGFDANQDGTITTQEFAQGLAKTRGDQAGSGFSQAVMALMDRNGVADGQITEQEFAAFSTAFVVGAEGRVAAR